MTRFSLSILAASSALAFATPALAGAILIINGSSTTSEPGTTSSITTQLSNLHTAVGNTVTVVDAVPVSFAGFQQVWDIRFSNSGAITSGVQSQYLSFLQGGGGMFVMGENSGFGTRNNSVLSLINAAGGGNLTFTTAGDAQTVQSPFTGPNAVTSINFRAAGGVTTFGTGQWISSNANGGAGVAFGVGTLANASAGALTTIFDVNFMETGASTPEQNLTKNLIGFINVQVPGAVPEPATWAMMIAGFGMIGASMRRRQNVKVSFI